MISVVIPIYNVETYLRGCINSLLEQTYTDFELLLVNDGSTDGSGDIIREFAMRDPRICVFTKENGGVSSARNFGIRNAKGDYVIFIDGDDSVQKNYLETYHSAFSEDVDIVVGGIIKLFENGEEEILSPQEGIYERNGIAALVGSDKTGVFGFAPNKMYRASLIKDNQLLFDEAFTAQEDLRFALSAYRVMEKCRCISYSGYEYRFGSVRRKIRTDHLLSNKLLSYDLMKENVCDTTPVLQDIRNVVFSAMLNDLPTKELHHMEEDLKLQQILLTAKSRRFEERLLTVLFLKKCDRGIEAYRRVRRMVKKIVGKKC